MKPSVFHPEALAVLLGQAVYYEERSAGLGVRFSDQVETAVQLAVSMPGVGSPSRYRTRRVFRKDLLHSVIYRETSESLVIVPVAPFKRKPDYWRYRK